MPISQDYIRWIIENMCCILYSLLKVKYLNTSIYQINIKVYPWLPWYKKYFEAHNLLKSIKYNDMRACALITSSLSKCLFSLSGVHITISNIRKLHYYPWCIIYYHVAQILIQKAYVSCYSPILHLVGLYNLWVIWDKGIIKGENKSSINTYYQEHYHNKLWKGNTEYIENRFWLFKASTLLIQTKYSIFLHSQKSNIS